MAERRHSMRSIFHLGFLTEICFICINNIYSKFRIRFFLIIVNMIDRNDSDLRWYSNDKTLPPELHHTLRDGSNGLLNAHTISIDSQNNDRYMGNYCKF